VIDKPQFEADDRIVGLKRRFWQAQAGRGLPGRSAAFFSILIGRERIDMGIFEKLSHEFIDIIEWTEPAQNDILAYRFPRYQNEIKMGAKLTVREGQNAAFVNEGQLADVFQPGMYTLQTENMPILSTLKGWKYGFNSPFKAEVYFISMRQWTDQKWGTQNPIMLRDAEFGPVRVRAFGTYAFHVADAGTFLKELVATDPSLETFEISNQLRNTIVARLTDGIAQAKIPVLDMAGNYEKISKAVLETIKPDLAAMGLALTLFYIENISLPPEVEKALDRRTEMGVLGDMNQYMKFQTATAIGDAAKNPGGVAGVGAGLGAGMAMANQMSGAMNQQPAAAAPPPLPQAGFYVAIDGQQTGPIDMAGLAALAGKGTLTSQTLVWKQGMAGWTAAASVQELQTILSAVPPPLPK
jgi:membrane protease subunit (stomatin/prohibitin family)